MQEQRSGRHAHHAQHPFQGVRQHLLNFGPHEAGGGQIDIRQRQHVLLNAALLFLVQAHHHQRGGEQLRQKFQRAQRIGDDRCEQQFAHKNGAPAEKRSRQQQIGERFVTPAFLIKNPGDDREHHRDAQLW